MHKGFTLGQMLENKKVLKKFKKGGVKKGSKAVKGYCCPAK